MLFSNLDKSYAVALSNLHKQPIFKNQSWLAPVASTEFSEILCAIFERFAAYGRNLELTVNGVSASDGFSIPDLEKQLGRYQNKLELIEQIHEKILELADLFYDYDMSLVTETELRACGLQPSSHSFPASLDSAKAALRKLVYGKQVLLSVDTSFKFFPYSREGFIYADWALPRQTVAGYPVEGYELQNTSACFGSFILNEKLTSRFQNRVRLALNVIPEEQCSWVYPHIAGGSQLLSVEDQTMVDRVATVEFPKELPESGVSVSPSDRQEFPDRVEAPQLPPVELQTKTVTFDLAKVDGASYWLLNRPRMDWVDLDSEYAYTVQAVRVSLNNYTLPQLPALPVDVTDFVTNGANELVIDAELGDFSWSDVYILEALHLDTFIPPPAYLFFKDSLYEQAEVVRTGDSYYYSYYSDNRKCWMFPALEDEVRFDAVGLLNFNFHCLPVEPRHRQNQETSSLQARTLYHDQMFDFWFTQDVGVNYDVVFSYTSVTGRERRYSVASGVVMSELTKLRLQTPTDAKWVMNVIVEFDNGDLPVDAAVSIWGTQYGQLWDFRGCSDSEEIFLT